MFLNILKGFIIGVCASAPLGPIAILVIQTTLNKGHRAGFVTGMGACLVDTLFAVIAIFALAVAQRLMDEHRELILVIGGLIVAVLGWRMCAADPLRRLKAGKTATGISIKDFIQSVLMGLSNPGAIFVIFALFAFFGIGPSDGSDWRVAPTIFSVSAGAAVYWFSVTALLDHFRKRFKMRTIIWINRLAGSIIVVIGLVLLGEGLFRVLFQGYPLI